MLIPVLIGVALADLLVGLPIDANEEFTGSFWDLLTPYGLWSGVTLLVLCLLHGSTFLALKTGDQVRARAKVFATRLAWPAVVLVLVYATWTVTLAAGGFWRVLAAAFLWRASPWRRGSCAADTRGDPSRRRPWPSEAYQPRCSRTCIRT